MKKNYDDVFIRNVIVGSLTYLREKIFIYNQIDEERRQIIEVPFYYSTTGDERFLQDKFLDYSWMDPKCYEDCIKKAEGNYDPIPRGILKYKGTQIRTDSLSNPYVRSTYNREIKGEIKAFSAMTAWYPTTLTLDVEIKCDTMIDVMKIQQELIRKLYKSSPYIVQFEGFAIHCRIQFPEENTVEKQFEFNFDDPEKPSTISFTIEIETYLPEVDLTTEFFQGNSMQQFNTSTDGVADSISKDRIVLLKGEKLSPRNIGTKPATTDSIGDPENLGQKKRSL